MEYNSSEGLTTFGSVFNVNFLLEVQKLQEQIEAVSCSMIIYNLKSDFFWGEGDEVQLNL